MPNCRSCGASDQQNRFCRRCGARLGDGPDGPRSGASLMRRRVGMVGGAVVILAVSAGAWIRMGRESEPRSDLPPPVSSPRAAPRANPAGDARTRPKSDPAEARRNERTALQDVRTVLSGQASYQASNGGFYEGRLGCLATPTDCIPGYPPSLPVHLDRELASDSRRAGYERVFWPGPRPPTINPAVSSRTSVVTWAFTAAPIEPGRSGLSSFCTDGSAKLVRCRDGRTPPVENGVCLVPPGGENHQ